jgi:phosphoribosylamine--glycine ligase
MKILVVGSGGREHALVWRLGRNTVNEIYAMPGNPGMARIAQCLPAADPSPQGILAVANSLDAELTVIGPEAPLVAGVVDAFQAGRRAIVGCSKEAAQLEGSKVFAKTFFQSRGIPTADFAVAEDRDEAYRALDRFSYPVVIKADGLAAGKGVIIAQDRAQARQAVDMLGPRLVIEEFLNGPEISFIVLSDGRNVVPLIPSRDHKRVFDGDQGPNTGGMGAYCDERLLTPEQVTQIMETIILPVVEATGYTGFLYAGLILTANGPKVLEFNVRLGDPETQALLPHLQNDFAEVLMAAANGNLGARSLDWKPGACVSVVLAAAGYPGAAREGDVIHGMESAESGGATIFQAGTRISWGGYITAGGRVLAVSASGPDLAGAAARAYAGVGKIRFEGMHYRRDIGRPYDRAGAQPGT